MEFGLGDGMAGGSSSAGARGKGGWGEVEVQWGKEK